MSSRVSDMVKMYNQPKLNPTVGTGAARKWPPVATTPGGNKPPPISAKPKPTANQANGGPRIGGVGAAPFNRGLEGKRTDPGGQNSDSIPPWKKTFGKEEDRAKDPPIPLWKQRQMEKEKQDEMPEKIPPWKQRQLEKENQREPPIPLWKQRQMEKEKQDHNASGNIPAWKQELNKGKVVEETKSNNENIPAWKQELNKSKEAGEAKSKNENIPLWKQKLNKSADEDRSHTKQPDSGSENDKASTLPPPPPNKPTYLGRNSGGAMENGTEALTPSRANQQNTPLSYRTLPKPKTNPVSVGNISPRRHSTKSENPELPGNEDPPKVRSSFLHSSIKKTNHQAIPERNTPTPPANNSPLRMNGKPRKLPIPPEVFHMPPPLKTSKPPRVVLPYRGKKKTTPLPPPPIGVTPPMGITHPLPSPASTDQRLPSIPGMRDLPPAPDVPPSLPSRFPSPSASRTRDLPLPPSMGDHNGGKSQPLPGSRAHTPLPPPPVEPDEIYDDPGEEPPPMVPAFNSPTPIHKQSSSDMIETWDDEDEEQEALYDETPDAEAPPTLPAGFPVPGAPVIIPQVDEDMYEDVEEYMRLKRQKAAQDESAQNSKEKEKLDKEKEKKKRDSDKKEKDIRKKFKLGKGEIIPEGHGVVKESCRGWMKDLAVTAGENIDIIRMTENPKGKWLVRNSSGNYGYVDSDKVEIDLKELRNTFGIGEKGSAISGGPPVPSMISGDDEAIYDQTADEDLYEEFG